MKYSKEYLNDKIIKSMGKFNFSSPVLEVGCGTGETLEAISKNYVIKGIDLSDGAVFICQRKRLNVTREDLFDFTEKFNSIICIDVIEHVKDDYTFIKHLHRILNNKGKLLVMAPSGKFMKDDLLFGHYRRYSKDSIIELFIKSNFIIESVEMFGYPIIYYVRLLMNSIYKLQVEKDLNLKKRTLNSSFENPFDKCIYARVYARIMRISLISKIVTKILLLQDLFRNSNKGFAVIVIAKKL